MKMNPFNPRKRDERNHRLFFSLLKQKGIDVLKRIWLKDHVQLLHTSQGKKVIKGFSSLEALSFQWNFSRFGKKRDKALIVHYELFPDGTYFFKFNHLYWGLMSFSAGEHLDYSDLRDQQLAFYRLQRFHQTYRGFFLSRMKRSWHLLPQWTYRIKQFNQVVHSIPFKVRSICYEMIKWGNYALTELSREPIERMEHLAKLEKQWIHGDVAAHNFLHLSPHGVRMLDYDLAAIAPTSYDYLQLANRILVSNGWNVHELCSTIPQYDELLKQRWFLLALLYPGDLFREWIYFFSKRTNVDIHVLLDYSENQFNLRCPTVSEIIHMLN